MQGRIQAGGIDKDVAFLDADHGLDDASTTHRRGLPNQVPLLPVGRQPHHQRAGALVVAFDSCTWRSAAC
jgi:hypothetical protein